jgi:hypothetical protein
VTALHVANGHATTGLIELAGVPGRTMVWCDPLHDGPVPGGVPDEELVRVRARFLASPDEDAEGVAADLRDWRTQIDQQHYDELVLWYEHDLFDQLNLIQLLTHLGGVSLARPITLVAVDAYAGRAGFKGIGQLEPRDVAALFEMRRPITEAQLALAARAWDAFRADDPRQIEALLAAGTPALPFLSHALQRHLEEFPSTANGLSRSEQRLMEQAADGPVEMREAWPRLVEGERWFFLTDTAFADRLKALAASVPALLTVHDAAPDPRSMTAGSFELTGAGRDVLAGAADRVRLCGIDRWLGGVHLHGRGPLWRWNGAHLLRSE